MANTFPSAGNVGIGTTTPQAPLQILSGSSLLATFQSQSPNTKNAYIQLISSNANFVWQISNQDASGGNTANGLAFLEKTAPAGSVARVYFQQGGSVGIGIMNNSARFAVANASGNKMVQLQGQAIVPGGMQALALGYGDNYDGVAIGDAGYIQAEHEGTGFQPLFLNPIAGSVQIGFYQANYYTNLGFSPFQPADTWPQGFPNSRLRVQQWLVASGNTENAMVSFVQNSVANTPADSSAASFYISISGGGATGGNGTAAVRALEAQVTRLLPASSNITRAIEVGLHSQVAGNNNSANIGVYLSSWHTGWIASGVRNDTAIYITGEDGWYNALVYTDETDSTVRFAIGQHGDITASAGAFLVDQNGNVSTNGTLAAANAVSGTALFSVDVSGNVHAANYLYNSSRILKKDIAPLSAQSAVGLLDGLEPVWFRYKHQDDRLHMGFVAEDTPEVLAPTRHGVSMPGLLAVLARVAKELQSAIEEQRKNNQDLQRRLDELRRTRRPPAGPDSPAEARP